MRRLILTAACALVPFVCAAIAPLAQVAWHLLDTSKCFLGVLGFLAAAGLVLWAAAGRSSQITEHEER